MMETIVKSDQLIIDLSGIPFPREEGTEIRR
jgi:hypothetical protein